MSQKPINTVNVYAHVTYINTHSQPRKIHDFGCSTRKSLNYFQEKVLRLFDICENFYFFYISNSSCRGARPLSSPCRHTRPSYIPGRSLNHCGICGVQSGTWIRLPPSTSVSPVIINPPVLHSRTY